MPRPRAPRRSIRSESLGKALLAAQAAEDKRAENIVILDLREQTLVADYFVLCTATSRVQMRAVADAVTEALSGRQFRGAREGDEAGQWVLLDYGDVVVHIFEPEARAFYRLERLWSEAPTVDR